MRRDGEAAPVDDKITRQFLCAPDVRYSFVRRYSHNGKRSMLCDSSLSFSRIKSRIGVVGSGRRAYWYVWIDGILVIWTNGSWRIEVRDCDCDVDDVLLLRELSSRGSLVCRSSFWGIRIRLRSTARYWSTSEQKRLLSYFYSYLKQAVMPQRLHRFSASLLYLKFPLALKSSKSRSIWINF